MKVKVSALASAPTRASVLAPESGLESPRRCQVLTYLSARSLSQEFRLKSGPQSQPTTASYLKSAALNWFPVDNHTSSRTRTRRVIQSHISDNTRVQLSRGSNCKLLRQRNFPGKELAVNVGNRLPFFGL